MSFANGTAEFGQVAAQWQKLVSDSWGQWAKSTVASESFATASGAYMDWTLSTQKMMGEMSGQVMETLDMPRRSDLARLAAQVQSVETRLLDQEESNEVIRDLLLALNAKLDKVASASAQAATVGVTASQAFSDVEVDTNAETLKAARTTRKGPKKGQKPS